LDGLILATLLVLPPVVIAGAVWLTFTRWTSADRVLRSLIAIVAAPASIYAVYRSLGSTNVDGDENATVFFVLAIGLVVAAVVVGCLEWHSGSRT
jgi:hypothetical protein